MSNHRTPAALLMTLALRVAMVGPFVQFPRRWRTQTYSHCGKAATFPCCWSLQEYSVERWRLVLSEFFSARRCGRRYRLLDDVSSTPA